MDSKETQQQENRNATTLAGPISAAALHEHPLMLEGSSPYPVATQEQPSMQRGRPRTDVIDGGGANVNLPAKRGRGHPLGSVNKQRRNPLGEEGRSFTRHVIDVATGEDIATKLVAFLNQERHNVCILSASGTVSRAWLQSDSPLGVVKYEGLYGIIHMSGTFLNNECHDGTVTITGKLSVSLHGPEFKMVWGCVGGMLVAGSPVQVTVGSLEPERVELSAPDNVLSLSVGGAGLPQSQGPQFSSEPSEEDGRNDPV